MKPTNIYIYIYIYISEIQYYINKVSHDDRKTLVS